MMPNLSRLRYALIWARVGFRTGWDAWGKLHAYAEQVASDDVADLEEERQVEAGTGVLQRTFGGDDGLR